MAEHDFYRETREACADSALARKLHIATERQQKARELVCRELPDVERFRDLAARIRDDALSNLDEYLALLEKNLKARGVRVHWAGDAGEACTMVRRVAEEHNVRTVVKSKSMLTEEIGLAPHLEGEGLEVVETDLGEFIIQLAGQRPSHIVIPAIHLSAEEVAGIFREKIGYTGDADPESLTRGAREYLRGKFRTAQMGISGVNLAMAEQGMWAVCTNEGNGRYVVNMPRVHLAVMGIERIVRNTTGASVILKLLAKFATGQRITQYVNMVRGPATRGSPEHVHLVIVDNSRSHILGTRYWEMLRCIRCGACLNACPVFKYIGGQSFPGCYSGPMGTVLLPLQLGLEQAGSTPKACSLCGLCKEVCPVKIPLPELILELRDDAARAGFGGWAEQWSMTAGAWVMQHPLLYRLAQGMMRRGLLSFSKEGWVKWMPSVPGRWTQDKDLPLPARKSFLSEQPGKGRKPGGGLT